MSTYAHTTIATSPRGVLDYCQPGACVRLRFGNAVLQLDTEELETVLDMVAMHDIDGEPAGGHATEHALIDIGDTGASFAFTRDEVAELHLLLARGVLVLAAGHAGLPSLTRPPASFLHLH